MTHTERVDHINRLLKEHDIRLQSRAEVLEELNAGMLPIKTGLAVLRHTTGIMPAYSCTEEDTIFMNDQDYGEEVPYFVALHEMGHLMTKKDSLKYMKKMAGFPVTPHDEIQSETLAWDWAIKNAIEITPTMDACKKYAFGTYEKHAQKYQEIIDRQSSKTVRDKGRGSNVSTVLTKARTLLPNQIERQLRDFDRKLRNLRKKARRVTQ